MTTMSTEPRRIAVVVGASRGIGAEIAEALARAGFVVAALGKTLEPSSRPGLRGSLSETVDRISRAGGEAVAVRCDVRDEKQILAAVQRVRELVPGGTVQVLVYNCGAITWGPLQGTPLARFDVMHAVNTRGLFVFAQALHDQLSERVGGGPGGRVVALCPPIYNRFARGKAAYAVTKLAASALVLGLAHDYRKEGKGVAAVGLWPSHTIRTAVTDAVGVPEALTRRPEVVADACVQLALERDSAKINGRLLVDEDYLVERGWTRERLLAYGSVPAGAPPPRIMPRRFPSLLVEEEDEPGAMDGVVPAGQGPASLYAQPLASPVPASQSPASLVARL